MDATSRGIEDRVAFVLCAGAQIERLPASAKGRLKATYLVLGNIGRIPEELPTQALHRAVCFASYGNAVHAHAADAFCSIVHLTNMAACAHPKIKARCVEMITRLGTTRAPWGCR